MKPWIKYVEPLVFDKELIEKLFDEKGNPRHVIYRKWISLEELAKERNNDL